MATLRKLLLSGRNWPLEAGVTFSGGVPSQPLSNLLDMRPQVVAEWSNPADPSSTIFQLDLGIERWIGVFAFFNFRTTMFGTVWIRAGVDPTFATNRYEYYAPTWPADSDPFSFDAWGNYTIDGLYRPDVYARLGMPRIFLPAASVKCRYIIVVISDPTNSGSVQLGNFVAAELYEPTRHFSFGGEFDLSGDESDVQTVPGGSSYIEQRGLRRKLNLGVNFLPTAEAWGQAWDWSVVAGKSTPIVAIPFSDPSEIKRLEKAAIYGLVTGTGGLSNPYAGLYSKPLQIAQLI